MWLRAHTTESGRLGAMFESQLGHTKDLKTCLALIDGRKGKLHMPCAIGLPPVTFSTTTAM